ncbi:DUF378 domain-containing protein [Caloranaerobacter sp. TR13]|uniref:DUF378 domain-containing protein n=1 Tax=Caloranaerobacter sp. TR13 TaxID=1302151 RepID=UPI001FA6F2CE|nr:DUF378 domain-containing protein [Caloranaerobacter sp. TR13]
MLKAIASIFILFGAINWGLYGLFNFDIVCYIFKSKDSIFARVIYALIGLSGLYTILYIIF